ncbi:DGQHR domain-containing protein [Synechococcus sp. CS-1329]|uniref:DGQHR domain-containing protein n=1 Tax=Synechococcus sp. CS-1329 TaxID=2847975 RepID=UPI00223AFE9F|nr:DGQHR domain-containing protein [Synechococcus sp. CS-1329]MCT0219227.1 DGQHR domain-containing protein [Synechococcus sp. CS-1329]
MNNPDYLDIPAVAYSQPGAVFYACSLPANAIVGRLEIRRRSQDLVLGMQRDENRARVLDVAAYAREDNSVFPTPIIVSAKSDVVRLDGSSLQLPKSNSVVGHVLDGQHRLLGLKELTEQELARFELLVVFTFDIDVYAEATIFATINSTQKQVSKSLMYDLFALQPGRSVEKSCHEIVRSLNDDPTSPFHRRIKILGKKMGEIETLSQAAFVDQIGRQIKSNEMLRKFYDQSEDWVIRKIISNCFSAVRQAQEQSTNQFPEDYFFRTTGFGGVAQALGSLVDAGADKGDVSETQFSRIMSKFFELKTSPPAGVGNAAMLEIKDGIVLAIGQLT